ncbi:MULTISPECIES: adenylate/guanylate cyclase domain-containing protein [unclassified Bradyrhizobium]|uniref:adenylate/guanylate cyclase domain-containing protein n=1 Tax=unclassified Bradyrhizobium TaxID=2631580 RepID=UPI0033944ADA
MTSGRVERRLAAVLAADVAGYSRLMGENELGTLEALKAHRREVVDPAILNHKGRTVKTTGDGMLVEFASAVDAVTCAMVVQAKMAQRNGSFTPSIIFRIGINIGDIIIDGDDIFGDGVNIAARVENECEPGCVYLSGNAYEQVCGKTAFAFDDLGERSLKNIERPVRLYAVRTTAGPAAARVKPQAEATKPLALPDRPSIAVLPFQNMSGDPEQEYFADGMVEDIITALSQFKSLFVIARNSSFVYKGKLIDIKQVGHELGVRYVLEGSVRKSANRVRITGQLIDTGTGAHHWADRFEGDLADIFDLQDRMTENVVGAIVPAMERAEIERATRKPTDNLDAYSLFLRGQAKLYQQLADREANREALRLFKRAIELDPEYASAYARAASCYAFAKTNGWLAETEDEIADASRLAHRAVELGKHDANVLAECGWTLSHVVRDLDGGSALIDRSLALNPNVIEALNWGGWTKLWLGEPEEAVQRFTRALRLSPLDPWAVRMRIGIAHAYFFLDRYEQAASLAVGALRETPDYQAGLRIAAASNAMAGHEEQARKLVIRLQNLNPTLCISKLKSVLGPYRHVEHVHRYEKGLRTAGLPE